MGESWTGAFRCSSVGRLISLLQAQNAQAQLAAMQAQAQARARAQAQAAFLRAQAQAQAQAQARAQAQESQQKLQAHLQRTHIIAACRTLSLSVVPTTKQELKSAFKKAALQHHPDRNLQNPEDAAVKFQNATSAFQYLETNLSLRE